MRPTFFRMPSGSTHAPPPPVPDMSQVMVPYLCGGDPLDLRAAPLEDKHYLQEDRSLNADIWELFPTEQFVPQLYYAEEAVVDECRKIIKETSYGVYTQESIAQTALFYERSRIKSDIITLAGYSMLLLCFYDVNVPLRIYSDRKTNTRVESVPALVALAHLLKEKGNTFFRAGEYVKAATMYLKGQITLYPWTSTPLLFTAETAAQYGVTQIEISLWNNLGLTALKLYETDDCVQTLNSARDCTEAVTNMRFASHQSIAKAYMRLERVGNQLRARPSLAHDLGVYPAQAARTAVDDAVTKAALAVVLVQRADPSKTSGADPGDAWAHKHCITSHTGCGIMTPLETLGDAGTGHALRVVGDDTIFFSLAIDKDQK